MTGYVIAQIDVTDQAAYEEYRQQVPATVAAYGGEFVVRGGAMEVLEGEAIYPRIVVVRFPSVDQARRWYESAEYAGPLALRKSASKGYLLLVEGA